MQHLTNFLRCIAIGFGRKRKDMDSLPGWQESDRAFHFDDGRFFHGDYKKGEQYHNGSPIEDGAVYGCGVDFRTNLMFFTKNGVVIGNNTVLLYKIMSESDLRWVTFL